MSKDKVIFVYENGKFQADGITLDEYLKALKKGMQKSGIELPIKGGPRWTGD